MARQSKGGALACVPLSEPVSSTNGLLIGLGLGPPLMGQFVLVLVAITLRASLCSASEPGPVAPLQLVARR